MPQHIDIRPMGTGSASDEKFDVDDIFPQTAFLIILSGERGSGKTVLIQALVRMYVPSMQYVFIFSPTQDLTDDYDFIKENKFFGKEQQVQTVFKFNDINTFAGTIQSIIEKQKVLLRSYERADCPNILLVLDDVLEQPNKLIDRRSGIIEKLAYSGRHYKVSCILATQLFRAVSNGIRSNASLFIIYSATNLQELAKVMEEFVLKSERKQVTEVIARIFDEPYVFITMVGKLIANRNKLSRRERLLFKFDYPLLDYFKHHQGKAVEIDPIADPI